LTGLAADHPYKRRLQLALNIRKKNPYHFHTFLKFVKISLVKPRTLKELGEILRQLREGKGLLLRQVAADLEMDTALLSKIERGDRSPKKEQLLRAAALFGIPSRELLVIWLAEKVNQLLEDEPFALEALDKCRNKLRQGNIK